MRAPSLTDRLLSPRLREGSAENVQRARLAMTLALVAGGFFAIAGVLQFFSGNHAAVVFDFACVSLIAGGIEVSRRTGRVVLVSHLLLGLIFVAGIVLSVTMRGAGLSGATLTMAVTPLSATLALGSRAGRAWLVPSLLTGVVLGVLGYFEVIYDHLSGRALIINDHMVLTLFTLALYGLAALYERRKDEALAQISELESRRREAELRELRAQVEIQLAQAEQFASLGRIAGATAHEINNPLAYLLGNLRFVRDNVSSDDADVKDALVESLEGAQRIQRIVSDLSAMTRTSNETLADVAVKDALTVALSLASPHTRTRARVNTRFDDVPRVSANEARLTQVFFNLLLNATQGLPQGQTESHAIDVVLMKGDGRVEVEITDAGQAPLNRGLGDVSLPVILGEAALRSFGGTLTLEQRGARSVACVHLPLHADDAEAL